MHLLTLEGAVLRDAMFIVSDLAGVLAVGWFVRARLRRHAAWFAIGTAGLVSLYLALKSIFGYR